MAHDEVTGAAATPDEPAERLLGRRVSVAVLVSGLALTAGLTVGALTLRNRNEDRLLEQRTHEAAAVITGSISGVQSPLASAATLAEATHGDPATFSEVMAPIVQQGRPFVSASLWPARASHAQPTVVVGEPLQLTQDGPANVRAMLAATAGKQTFTVVDLLGARDRRLGYALRAPSPTARYVVYAEAALPRGRTARVARDSAFADLDYALYFGSAPTDAHLLASSIPPSQLPFGGRHAADAVPFGTGKILVVLRPRSPLGGALLDRLPWLLLAAGLVLTFAATWLVDRLVRTRSRARAIATDNARLYGEQQSVAQALQHALLPDALPTIAGLNCDARYLAGVHGLDIGGDWYDVVALDDNRVLFVVGDVSGRGVAAASTMAQLRFAVRAYAALGDPPGTILERIGGLIDVEDGHFATVLCGTLDLGSRTLSLADAGHPVPVLIGSNAAPLACAVGPPIGVQPDHAYGVTTVPIDADGALVAFTDGLVERRDEPLDAGLARVHDTLRGQLRPAGEILDLVIERLDPARAGDDTVVLVLRWDVQPQEAAAR